MTHRSKLRAGTVALGLTAVLLLTTTPTASAQTGGDVVEACDPLSEIPEVGGRVCGGIERLTWLAAQHCRRAPGLDEVVCPGIDGRDINEAAVAAFEGGWAARALDLQRDLDRDVPLTDSLTLHTHNSANSTAYAPSVSTNDANQVLTITDQLRLGIRGIEIDVHWTPNPAGDPADAFREPVQCHGEPVATPLGTIHGGCSVDQPLVDLLTELRTWLDQPENADEFVLLYLENVLDDDETAHDDAAASIESTIGDIAFRPTAGGGCQDLPVERSKNELVSEGARVLITGNCGPGAWTDLVFQRGPSWNESGGTTDYLAGSDCDAERAAHDYDSKFIRRWEDSTFLSLMAGAGSYVSPEVAAAMVACGVNLPGLDQLHPGDDRLPAFVWSWREQEPGVDAGRACAAQGEDARFGALDCALELPFACRTIDGGWALTADAVSWVQGDVACQTSGHVAAGVPANGWDNELLRRIAGDGDVWLAYGRNAEGDWVAGIPTTTTDPGDVKPGKGPKDKDPKDKPDKPSKPKTDEPANGTTVASARNADGTDVGVRRSLPFGVGVLGVLLASAFFLPKRRRDRDS